MTAQTIGARWTRNWRRHWRAARETWARAPLPPALASAAASAFEPRDGLAVRRRRGRRFITRGRARGLPPYLRVRQTLHHIGGRRSCRRLGTIRLAGATFGAFLQASDGDAAGESALVGDVGSRAEPCRGSRRDEPPGGLASSRGHGSGDGRARKNDGRDKRARSLKSSQLTITSLHASPMPPSTLRAGPARGEAPTRPRCCTPWRSCRRSSASLRRST